MYGDIIPSKRDTFEFSFWLNNAKLLKPCFQEVPGGQVLDYIQWKWNWKIQATCRPCHLKLERENKFHFEYQVEIVTWFPMLSDLFFVTGFSSLSKGKHLLFFPYGNWVHLANKSTPCQDGHHCEDSAWMSTWLS